MRSELVRLRSPALAAVLGGLSVFLLHRLAGYVSLGQWLVFRYLSYWALSLGAALASTIFGYALVVRLVGRSWSVPERLVVGATVGVATFGIGWNVLGFLQLHGPLSFVAWPLLLLGLGAPTAWRERSRLWRFRMRTKRLEKGLAPVEIGLLCLGLAGATLAYAANLTPENVSFDARWYHLPIAERYAAAGGVVRFPDGWFLGGYPQLASILYSWCFCVPFGTTFDRVELCLHFEFVLFLLTLAGIAVLARVVAPHGRPLPRFGAAVLFLFPEFFIYDSSLNGGADHIAAFWAPALFLLTRRVWTRFGGGALALLALVVSAVLLTKYTAYGLLVGPAVGLLARATWLVSKQRPAHRTALQLLSKGGLALGGILVLTMPHWLKNFVFYDNPFFPLAADWFDSRPWTSSATAQVTTLYASKWTPTHDVDGVLATLAQPVTFAFTPSDWSTFHRDLPMFGFLFTLLTPVLLFARTRSLLGLYSVANLGVMFWFWTYHQDRYLQAYLPWMVAATWVIAVLATRLGRSAALATCGLFFLQWAWGADAPFFGSHVLAGQPLSVTIEHLAGGFARRPLERRLVVDSEMEQLRRKLPQDARVLRHEFRLHLGLGVSSVTDVYQSGIDFAARPSPAGVHAILSEMGVTHLVWRDSFAEGFTSMGTDVLFFDFVEHHVAAAERIGDFVLAPLGEGKELSTRELRVLYAGCDPTFAPGVYGAGEMSQLWDTPGVAQVKPRTALGTKTLSRMLTAVDAVVWGPRCQRELDDPSRRGFVLAAQRGESAIFVRRSSRPAGASTTPDAFP